MEKTWASQANMWISYWKSLRRCSTTYPRSLTLLPQLNWVRIEQSDNACGARNRNTNFKSKNIQKPSIMKAAAIIRTFVPALTPGICWSNSNVSRYLSAWRLTQCLDDYQVLPFALVNDMSYKIHQRYRDRHNGSYPLSSRQVQLFFNVLCG